MFTSCALMKSSNNVFQASLMFRLSLKCRNVIQETTEITQKICQGIPLSKIDSFLIFIFVWDTKRLSCEPRGIPQQGLQIACVVAIYVNDVICKLA